MAHVPPDEQRFVELSPEIFYDRKTRKIFVYDRFGIGFYMTPNGAKDLLMYLEHIGDDDQVHQSLDLILSLETPFMEC